MAGGKEHRMVFDIRGRRRHVVKAVYAVLAVLMGASLFLVLGPVNVGSLLGGSSGTSEAGKVSEEQAERVERRLRKSPEDPDLLLSLGRARLAAGNSLRSINSSTGEVEQTLESRAQYEKASEAWSDYLKATDEPSAGAAQLMTQALLVLAQTSRTPIEVQANIKATAQAQKIVVEQRPNLNSLSTYAIYEMYALDYAAAEKAAAEAKKLTRTKFERENLENKIEEAKKTGEGLEKSLAEAKKATKSSGKAQLENPLGGLSAGGGLAE